MHFDDPIALGNLARAFLGVTREQVDQALALQEQVSTPSHQLGIGAALVQLGAATQEQITGLLCRQWRLRQGMVTYADASRLLDYAARGVVRLAESWCDLSDRVAARFTG